ncbi:MAG: ATP-binding cassette domain-containing protein [Gemmatimonadota bacterium]
MIRVEGLRKTYGRVTALHGLDAHLRAGRVTAIVGPNGSGKTTLIKVLLGLVRPDAGELRIDGAPVGDDPGYRARIGYMPQEPAFPENLRVEELTGLLDDLRGGAAGDDGGLAARLGVPELADRPLGGLSGGMRQKVSAALAFRYDPALLVLDEPTAGLDPVARAILKDRVLEASGEGRTVLITSHILTELEDLADDLLFLVDGRSRFAGEVDELLQRTGARRLEEAFVRLMERGSMRAEPRSGRRAAGSGPRPRLEAM